MRIDSKKLIEDSQFTDLILNTRIGIVNAVQFEVEETKFSREKLNHGLRYLSN